MPEILTKADAFVIVSAEYNHGEPAALKNLLDHFQSEYLYKPSGIVTYSAGPFGGVRALVTLRAILAELGTPSIPSAFPISHVGDAFDADGIANDGRLRTAAPASFSTNWSGTPKRSKHARGKQPCDGDPPAQQALVSRLVDDSGRHRTQEPGLTS